MKGNHLLLQADFACCHYSNYKTTISKTIISSTLSNPVIVIKVHHFNSDALLCLTVGGQRCDKAAL